MGSKKPEQTTTLAVATFPACLAIGVLGALIGIWSFMVNRTVSEPYLDEVFHVGQAQTYLAGNLFEWDPKITTPPGLYASSLALSYITNWAELEGLRALNALVLPCMIFLLLSTDAQHWNVKLRRGSQPRSEVSFSSQLSSISPLLLHQLHTAFNICLFPPLFFFTGLYYTDVASTVSVMLCWSHFMRIYSQDEPSFISGLVAVVLGLISLSFRQTNIFWVSLFPAAILIISKIDLGAEEGVDENGGLLDPPVREATVDEYLFFILSLCRKSAQAVYMTFKGHASMISLIKMLIPYATIMVAFIGFVAWNGGVVLGDKSNHVATLHLAQLLYIWPYITFFSVPLTYPYLLQGMFALLAMVPTLAFAEPNFIFSRKRVLPRMFVGALFLAGALLIVRYNTIIHPFTLADNRHYTFYVFRLLRRHRAIRFLVTPVYVVGSWSVIQTLGAPAQVTLPHQGGSDRPVAKQTGSTKEAAPASDRPLKLNHASAGEGSNISFVLVWLGTTALQLATAPLVEPRYFILPWIMWRLHVPQACPSAMLKEESPKTNVKALPGWLGWLERVFWYDHDHRLWLETVWFMAINAVTGYIFLYWGFAWVQEPGKIQRFMW